MPPKRPAKPPWTNSPHSQRSSSGTSPNFTATSHHQMATISLLTAPTSNTSAGRTDAIAAPTFLPSRFNHFTKIWKMANDGTDVQIRREELTGRPEKQADGSARTREANLGSVLIQTVCDDEGKPLRNPGFTSYTGTHEGSREVAVLLRQEARHPGSGPHQTGCLHQRRRSMDLGKLSPDLARSRWDFRFLPRQRTCWPTRPRHP